VISFCGNFVKQFSIIACAGLNFELADVVVIVQHTPPSPPPFPRDTFNQ